MQQVVFRSVSSPRGRSPCRLTGLIPKPFCWGGGAEGGGGFQSIYWGDFQSIYWQVSKLTLFYRQGLWEWGRGVSHRTSCPHVPAIYRYQCALKNELIPLLLPNLYLHSERKVWFANMSGVGFSGMRLISSADCNLLRTVNSNWIAIFLEFMYAIPETAKVCRNIFHRLWSCVFC